MPAGGSRWPELSDSWGDTRDTVHLWSQVVGKVRLALEPMVNHWWQIPLYVSARGLTTSLMPAGDRGLEIEFDFLGHEVELRTTDGRRVALALAPRSVANFHAAVMEALDEFGTPVRMMPRPVELPEAIPFPDDEIHRAYDADAMQRFWLALVQAQRVLTRFRAGFVGKASPVHFFWGAFDLAVTRFSGQPAPIHPGGVPNCADWVMHRAYSHEVSSCGFWPGPDGSGAFYAYAYPEPDGFAGWPGIVPEGFYDPTLHEFLLPYDAVREAADPDALLLGFLQSTYEAAAELGRWDRPALEISGDA